MNILGIETSCDETAAAVVTDGRQIRSNVISSQVAVHRPYGGVVPELASRHHLELITAVVEQALAQAGLSVVDLDAVAATYGPGLASSLLVGLNFGKSLAFGLGRPFVPVNHMEAHLYSAVLDSREGSEAVFPLLSLIVSGGHTLLVRVTSYRDYQILGQTLDDAAGEAFDKVAKLLGLGYPGGPVIDQLAAQGRADAVEFPRSLLHDPGDDFSFSGLKTAVMYYHRQHPTTPVADVCASFQEAVVDVLVGKLVRAAERLGISALAASGGVSRNRRFRQRLAQETERHGWRIHLAPADLCTDNAAMIAAIAFHRLPAGSGDRLAVDIAPSCGLETVT